MEAHPYRVDYSSTLRQAYASPQQAEQAQQQQAEEAAGGGGERRHRGHHVSTVPELSGITRTADILVVAVGYPHLVRRHWVKPGAVVIDVGINVEGEQQGQQGQPGTSEACATAQPGQQQPGQQQQGQQQHSQRHPGEAGGGAAQQPAPAPDAAWRSEGGYGEESHHPFHVVGDVDFYDVAEVAAALTPVPGGVGPMTIAAVLHNTAQAARYNLGLEKYDLR